MADNIAVTAGSGTTVAADEVSDGTLGTVKVQYVKIMDGTLDGTSKAAVGANGLKVDGSAVTQPVSSFASASNGYSISRQAALSNTAVAVKSSAGVSVGGHFYNPNTADAFLQFYDVAAGSVTVGTTTPNWTLWIPGGGAIDGEILPLQFSTAISVAATTTITGGTAPSTGLLANFYYK